MLDPGLTRWRARRLQAKESPRSNKARLQESTVVTMRMAAPGGVSLPEIQTSQRTSLARDPSTAHSRDLFVHTTELPGGSNIPCTFSRLARQLPTAAAAMH